jgi:hypothetical protein
LKSYLSFITRNRSFHADRIAGFEFISGWFIPGTESYQAEMQISVLPLQKIPDLHKKTRIGGPFYFSIIRILHIPLGAIELGNNKSL